MKTDLRFKVLSFEIVRCQLSSIVVLMNLGSPSGPLGAIAGRFPFQKLANEVRTLEVAGNREAILIAERLRRIFSSG